MPSAKLTFKVQDRSSIVSSLTGVSAGLVLVSEKGFANKITTNTNETQLIDQNGAPNPKLGTTIYSGMSYLSQGNKLYTVRALHEDAKYAAALIKSKVEPVPLLGEEMAPQLPV